MDPPINHNNSYSHPLAVVQLSKPLYDVATAINLILDVDQHLIKVINQLSAAIELARSDRLNTIQP